MLTAARPARVYAALASFKRVLGETTGDVGAAGPKRGDEDLGPGLTLERLFDDRELINFRMSALQRSLVRAIDGTPQDAPAPPGSNYVPIVAEEMERHYGQATLPALRPTVVIPMTGVRAGKTLITTGALVQSICTCSFRHVPSAEELADGVIPDEDGMTGVRPGELVRALIVTPKVKSGRKALADVIKHIKGSRRLKPYIVHETMEKLVFRRPCDGQHVLIEIVAMSAGGTNLRSTWIAGIVFDEAAFADNSEGEDAAVVNLQENYNAAVTRLLHGAQLLMPSSPWADSGTYYTKWKEARGAFGELDAEGRPNTVLSFHACSREMNPALPRKLEEEARRADPTTAAREYDAQPVSSLNNLLIPPAVMERLVNRTRSATLPYKAGVDHYSGSDLGFRRNSSAIAIARREQRTIGGAQREVAVLVYHEEWIPPTGKPLVPSVVVKHFGGVCQAYGVPSLEGDRAYVDSAIEHLASLTGPTVGYVEFDGRNNADLFTRFRTLASEGLAELPFDPRLHAQLSRILLVPGDNGQMRVILPKQGRAHADLALSVVMAVVRAADAVKYIPAPDDRWQHYMPRFDADAM